MNRRGVLQCRRQWAMSIMEVRRCPVKVGRHTRRRLADGKGKSNKQQAVRSYDNVMESKMGCPESGLQTEAS